MAGYSRQSAADIIPTATVRSAPVNAEFNKLRDAFTFDSGGTTGHKHDGSSDEGSYVPLIADIDGLNKVVVDTSNNRHGFFVEVSSSAVEQLRIQDGVIVPVTTNDIDLGTGSLQFKDAYFDGTVQADLITVDEGVAITGYLTVNGNTVIGDNATQTVTVNADVASNLVPSADSTYTIGDSSNYWSHAYLDAVTTTGDVTIGGNFSVTGTADFTNTTLNNVSDPSSAQQAATKNYVDTQINNLVGGAPGTLDTLNEIAAAINDDANVYTTLTASIATKLPLAGGTMTGDIALGGNRISGAALTPLTASELTSKSYVDGILGSATDAAASAAAAAISEANAAASYDSFDDRYLGAKSSAPATDNDGDALTDGVLYYNTTSGFMYVYDTTDGWKLAGSAVNGTSSRQTYIATGGQTSFAITYDVGFVDVWLNGAKLLAGTDFTATNGTSVELAVGATGGDVVDIIAFGTFTLANTLVPANNLGDVASAATARTNLGLEIGVDVQAYDANLPAWPSTVDATEVGYLNGVTSSIQTQLNAKLESISTYTGDVDITGELIVDSYNETYQAVTSTSNATTVDCESGNTFMHTLTENTTFTFSNPPTSGVAYTMSIEIIQDGSASGYTVTWPASVDWPSATAPTLTGTASAIDVFVFTTRDGGTTWYGFTAGQDFG
jgi:hypothetical protein